MGVGGRGSSDHLTNDDHLCQILPENDHGRDGRKIKKKGLTALFNLNKNTIYDHVGQIISENDHGR